MSEEIDLNINHLCTTEDAFEQFQATSMYEEDEFITLSDIVSPPPQAPDLSADLLDIPYENEVVLETQLDEQVPEVNSTIEIGLEDTKQAEFFSPLSTEHNPEVHAEIALESKPKRGRRKNTPQSESILTVNQNHNEQSNNKQGISAPDSIPTKSTPPAYKKRSRKPKRKGKTSARRKINGQTSLDDNAEVSNNTEQQSGSLLNSTPISNSVSESENASVGRKPIRRKGCNSKKKQEENIDTPKGKNIEIMETETHASDSKSNDVSLTNTLNTITPKRGRRKRKDFSEKSTLKEQEPVTTFGEMSLDQSQTEEIVNASDEVPVKSPKKQRRSKKTCQEVTTKDQKESGENYDFNDDICLSQLKETLEPTDTFDDAMEICESMDVLLEEVVTTKTPVVESNAELPTVTELKIEHVEGEQGMGTDQQQCEDVKNEIKQEDVKNEIKQEDAKNEIKQEEYRNNVTESNEDFNDSLLIEDTSKRPKRSKARKTFHYDEGSDEDPFANVESSDEEPKRSKKGKKYYSDDEYVPGSNKRDNVSSSDVSDSDIDAEVDELVMTQRRKKQRLDTSLDNSPRKRGRKPKLEKEANGNSLEVKTITPDESHTQDDDIEICLQSSLIKADEDSKQKLGWGASKEFENFIAKRIQGTDIKIKKASSVQPLEIPVLDPNDSKKTVETSMQTTQITTSSVEVQTSAPYDVLMKDNVSLTSNQAENACEFLKGIVKTTADLGELMTQKSEDFIKKKINTSHITDTLKMDYCVRKSFLLFKLAKHNLMQMEEDLSKQYEEFLTKNDLLKHRETPKVLTPVKKSDDGDSDCEIIDAPTTVVQKPKKDVKPKFNPKTVFLNKELSIKIAKKPSEEKKEQKLQIKGRHTVWISDSVMVKKVKPTQSFLAQDSRNKKPPDYVTIEMVNNFFKEYERQQALSTCAPFVTTEWLSSNKMYVCSYSFTKTDDFSPATIMEMPSGSELNISPDTQVAIMENKHCQESNTENKKYSPRSLFSLCTQALQNYVNISISKPCDETEIQNGISLNTIKSPKTLYSMCVNNLQGFLNDGQIQENVENIDIINVVPLQTLCSQKVIEMMGYSDGIGTTLEMVTSQLNYQHDIPYHDVKTLFSLSVLFIQNQLYPKKGTKTKLVCDKFHPTKLVNTPNTLKNITIKVVTNLMNSENEINEKVEVTKLKSLSDLCFETVTNNFGDTQEHTPKECLTINSIDRLTEEAYFNMEESTNFTDNQEYYDDDDTNFYEDEAEEHDFDETSNTEDSNWNSQVDVKEFISIPNNLKETFKPTAERNVLHVAEEVAVTRIKIEPEEEHEQIVDSSLVKTEPLHNFDEMTIIPESIMTNSVSPVNDFSSGKVQRKGSASYDVDSFETFVRTNKMMHDLNEGAEIFSQSAARVRRQYEPDSDPENDIGMSLLVPQTFEPLFIENAKDSLMESSGDENSSKKPAGKKKTDRRKVKGKKVDITKSDKQVSLEKSSTKEITKEKQPVCNEIAVLTRRMRGKIRQEEKKVESSDSEHENGSLISKKDKESDNILSKKGKENTKDKERDNMLSKKVKENTNNKTKQKIDKIIEDEIQCNNVDSTEQLNEQNKCNSPDPSTLSFTGFSAIDQNEGFNYQKYVKYVYDKILTSESDEGKSKPGKTGPLFNPEEPVELLECEPTMPIFENQDTAKPADITSDREIAINERPVLAEKEAGKEPLPYTTRHGWKCYQLDPNDPKLYSDAQIVLEKLPETFVDTYFKYQNISNSNKEDEEVNRLINLQSLNRPAVKEGRGRGRPKRHPPKDQVSAKTGLEEDNTDSRVDSPTFSEPYDELTPSEDEDAKVDDESAPTAKNENSSENTLAKSSLMDDNETDEETGVKIKKEIPDADANDQPVKKYKPGPKSKCKPPELVDSESFMLTADKMMNRELNLLHAPIVPADQIQETLSKGPVTRNKQKNASKSGTTSKRMKAEDDGSSSEEEKHQWFTIKEKLLKKMINKKDTTREDDAKRAKLVSEFIERRGDLAENYLAKRRKVGRSKRSLKKMLERQKQFKVLSRELFGDVPDTPHQGKGRHSSYFKGRRNIRKVLDKKSLAKSTVLANMEEFERKRRINIRQSRLREILGCEEGVNVLVINDEVCLEYDFESNRPVVTIHQFFTKVMKAHQYEGVKFMWDACFESLEHIEAGHPGGGCILAHCMGLGKTLQVLALLHTVLTHPRVGMQRVLVCCPLSTVLNWVDEIHKWIGPVTDQIKVFELSKLRKTNVRAYQLEDWYKGGGIFIIGYELFRSLTTLDPYLDDVRPVIVNKIRSALLDPGPDIIICDEGHLLKNDCSVLAVAMSRVRTARRIVLTGTPMQNNLREYYCMVNFVKPNLLGTYAEYSNRFENPIMNGQHRDSIEEDIRLMKARTHILHKVLEGCLQRQEASVLYPYLPKKHEYTVFVSLSKCQWDLYKHYLQNCTNEVRSNKNNVLKDFHILQKIWSHPQVLHNFQSRSADAKNKLKIEKLEDDLATEDLNAEDIKPSETDTWWLQYLDGGEMLDSLHSSNKFVCVFRILEECIALGDKLLIFSTSLFTMDALEYFLKKIKSWSLGKEYYRLDGSVPAEVRQKWCREFNADHNVSTKLFLISTRAGCLGLNMTAANRVIILDTSWNPAHDIQSIFRVYRFGQKKDCYIYRLVALGTMEQKIYERSVTKQAVACRVVDEQQIDRHYNMADLTELYKYDEAGVGVAGGVAVGVEDVVLLRVARDINLHAVHEHDSLLRGEHEQNLPEHERNAAWVQFQMEHAHKQEDLVPAPVPSLTLTTKKVHSQDYTKGVTAKSTIVKAEREEDAVFKQKPDKKRGTKKNTVVTCSIPIESLPAGKSNMPLNQDREEELVSKITHILIKHNFHIRQEPREIANLVSNVRRIVASGKIEDMNETDELSVSIANLLLQNDLPMRQLTNIVCESVNNTIVESTASSSKEDDKKVKGKSGRTKGRKGYVYEEVKPVEKEVGLEYDVRRRRRAALEAERSFDTMNNAVIDVGDDSDAEFVPDADVHLEIGNEPEENDVMDMDNDITDMENDTGDTENDEVQNVTVKEELKPYTKRKSYETPKANDVKKKDTIRIRNDVFDTQTKKLHEEMNSILLSDDDEPPPKKRPGPARKTMKFKTHEENVQKTVESTKKQGKKEKETVESTKTHKEKVQDPVESNINVKSEEDKIPLHPSLLSNQNFIKIVAHTYLTGNPMLDEDAATLAAQYSTQKALNEFESTGKEIKSGPLYDIAVQVLGIDILKKLHHTKGKAAVKSAQPTPEKLTETTKETTPEPAKPGPKLKTIKLKIRRPVEGSISAMPSSLTSTVVSSSSFTPLAVSSSSLTPLTVSSSSFTPLAVSSSSLTPLTVSSSSFTPLAVSSSSLTPLAVSSSLFTPLVVSSSSFTPLAVSSSSFTPLVVQSPSMAPSSLIATPTVPAQLPVLTPAPNANVVPVGFYRLGARPSSAPWTHLNINSCLERSNGFFYSHDSFKGAAEIPTNNTHQSAGECILPDDDDIHIISDSVIPQPAPTVQPLRLRQVAPAPATTPGNTNILPRNSVPLVLSNVSAGKFVLTPMDTNSPVQNNITPPHNTKTVQNILSKRNDLLSSAANVTPPVAQLTIDPNTITLDSDDEDCLPSVNFSGTSSAAPVVPVSLTAANTHSTIDQSALSYGLGTSTVHIGVPPTSAANLQPIIQNSQLGSTPFHGDTKYVVIPSSNIKYSKRADLPSGVVPVALSRMPPPWTHQSAANETVEILNDDAESILPVSTWESEGNFKKLCKPGDVLRISKSGKIEVLNRRDQDQPVLPANNISSTALNSGPTQVNISTTVLSNKHTPATPHPKLVPTRVLKGSTIETKQKETPAKSTPLKSSTPAKSTPLKSSTPAKSTPFLKSSTPAKSTPFLKSSTPAKSNVPRTPRPNSPLDPLSILKDVIHIEADNYDLEQKSNDEVTFIKATANNFTNSNKAKPESLLINSIAKNKMPAAKLTDSAWHKKITNKDKAATEPQSKPITTQSILNNYKTIKVSMSSPVQKQEQKSNVVTPSQQNRKTKTVSASDSKKDKRVTDTVIDITSLGDEPPPSADRNKGKLKLGSTIVGTSKDIILCGAGKAIKRPQAPTVSAFEAKRASTSTESASAKKKKTDKPLTLKDFDIDDIDDIIELD